MSSTTKALQLLLHFSTQRPEIGLSDLCRIAQRGKATTHRHLQELEEAGFVEQNPSNRQYRLGPALLQLARTRELTVPRKACAEPILKTLAHETGETSHASVLSRDVLFALASCESTRHSIRVISDIDRLPLHATASGLCALAFGPQELTDVARGNLQAFTENTIASEQTLEEAVQSVRATGFGRTIRSIEDEVSSLAAPVFDGSGAFAGTVSVASVAARFTPDLEHLCQHHLITASHALTRGWGGIVPEQIEALWDKTLSHSKILGTVS